MCRAALRVRPRRRPGDRRGRVSWRMAARPSPVGPIDAVDALVSTEVRLLDLLDSLTVEDWDRPTIVPAWRVRHVAGHLLDTALRRLSLARDGVAFEGPASEAAGDLRTFIDRINAEGVQVYGRLSPPVLASLMRPASQALCAYLGQRDPHAPAAFPVSWAGEAASAHWFDVARELTERWHHQQQIRLALDRPGLMSRDLYHPVLDCFMRALPRAYHEVAVPSGTHLAVRVTGEAGGTWRLYRDDDRWILTTDDLEAPAAIVTMADHVAWRVFTKGLAAPEARRLSRIEGSGDLAAPVFSTIAIVG
jgi:uncharacterized protein (TIGR03083 family)